MKNFIYLIVVTIILVTACEDPIDVNLDEAPSLVVVDAWLNDIPDATQAIRLAQSQSYFDSTFLVGINDANLTVKSTTGNSYNFELTDEDGYYQLVREPQSAWFLEPIGTGFNLEFTIAGVTYSSSSVKNRVPLIDSIFQEERTGEAFIDDGIFCNFFATDLLGVGDTYWIKTYKNGEYLNRPGELNIAYDAGFSSGSEVDNLVFIQPIQELNNPVDDNFAPIPWVPGDTIRVEIHSITNEAFFYMEILRDQLLNSSNGIFAEPLANTNGNIVGSDGKEVLGFFNVAATSVMEEVIAE